MAEKEEERQEALKPLITEEMRDKPKKSLALFLLANGDILMGEFVDTSLAPVPVNSLGMSVGTTITRPIIRKNGFTMTPVASKVGPPQMVPQIIGADMALSVDSMTVTQFVGVSVVEDIKAPAYAGYLGLLFQADETKKKMEEQEKARNRFNN